MNDSKPLDTLLEKECPKSGRPSVHKFDPMVSTREEHMNVILRPIPHGAYAPEQTDAISCTYSMDGFTPMNSVLVAYGLDRDHFKSTSLEKSHHERGFCVLMHSEIRPAVITSSKTEDWGGISDASLLILKIADLENHKSLCMTHFAFVLGEFPEIAFGQCMQGVHLANHFTTLERIVVDVDEKFFDQACSISAAIQKKLDMPLPVPEFNPSVMEPKWQPKNIELEPVTSTAYLHEKAETGDTESMTRLGQLHRRSFPILALKWLSLAASRGSGGARTLLEHTKSQVSEEVGTAAYRLSEFWLSDLPKRMEQDKRQGVSPKFLSWLLWRQGAWTLK